MRTAKNTCYSTEVILRPDDHDIAFRAIESYTMISDSSAATKLGVKLHLFFTLYMELQEEHAQEHT